MILILLMQVLMRHCNKNNQTQPGNHQINKDINKKTKFNIIKMHNNFQKLLQYAL